VRIRCNAYDSFLKSFINKRREGEENEN
jgi:hypothetical protein